MKRFENKIAVVTGGANGLGENLVRRLVDEGARVAVVDIEADALKKVCDSLPDVTFGVLCDVSVKAQVEKMVGDVVKHFGRIDLLFNNAGLGIFKPFFDLTEEDWRKVIDVNLNGAFFVGQAVTREMVRQGIKGVVVNTSSLNAYRSTARTTAYSASKGGVRQLTRAMSLELAEYGIRVNEVAPGSAMTRITENTRNDKEKYARMTKKYTAGRFAKIEEVTSVMLFLASDDATYVHGDSYLVDSGYSIQ